MMELLIESATNLHAAAERLLELSKERDLYLQTLKRIRVILEDDDTYPDQQISDIFDQLAFLSKESPNDRLA